MNQIRHSIEENCHIIFDSIEEGVFTVDLDWCITSFNRAAEKITGVSREIAVGRLCSEVFGTNVCNTPDCAIRKALHTDTPIVNMPVYIIRSDAKRIPISVNATILKDRSGRMIGGVETFRDLSAISQVRKSLRTHYSFENMVSKNQKMLEIFSTLLLIADSDCNVLMTVLKLTRPSSYCSVEMATDRSAASAAAWNSFSCLVDSRKATMAFSTSAWTCSTV